MYNDIAISNLSRLTRNYHYNLVSRRDIVTADIFVSRGMAGCNANVDLFCRVCNETVSYTNEDVYIRNGAPKDHAKCCQMRQA
jgi:hypothetical protein